MSYITGKSKYGRALAGRTNESFSNDTLMRARRIAREKGRMGQAEYFDRGLRSQIEKQYDASGILWADENKIDYRSVENHRVQVYANGYVRIVGYVNNKYPINSRTLGADNVNAARQVSKWVNEFVDDDVDSDVINFLRDWRNLVDYDY